MYCQTQLQVGVISIWAGLPIMLSCPQHMTVVGCREESGAAWEFKRWPALCGLASTACRSSS